MIPLKINGKYLVEIFEPTKDITGLTEDQIQQYSIEKLMYPTSVALTSETYSRDADRTADFELKDFLIVNRKSKPEFTWSLLKYDYCKKLLDFLQYDYNFKDADDNIIYRNPEDISITYNDFIGERTIAAYLGQTIEGTLVEYDGVLYWQNFRIAFPER